MINIIFDWIFAALLAVLARRVINIILLVWAIEATKRIKAGWAKCPVGHLALPEPPLRWYHRWALIWGVKNGIN